MTFQQTAQQTLDVIKDTVPAIYPQLYKFYNSDEVATKYKTIAWGFDSKKRPVIKLKDVSFQKFIQNVLDGQRIARGVSIYINPVNRLAFIDYTDAKRAIPTQLMTRNGLVFDDLPYSITSINQIDELRQVDEQLRKLANVEASKKDANRLESLQAAYIFDELYLTMSSKGFTEKDTKPIKRKGSSLIVYKDIKVTTSKEPTEKQIIVDSVEEAAEQINIRLAGADNAINDFLAKIDGRPEIEDNKAKVYIINKLNQKLTGAKTRYIPVDATVDYAPFSPKRYPKLYINVKDPNIVGIYYAMAATGIYDAMADYKRWLDNIEQYKRSGRKITPITTVPLQAQQLRTTESTLQGFSRLQSSPELDSSRSVTQSSSSTTIPLQISTPKQQTVSGFDMPDVSKLRLGLPMPTNAPRTSPDLQQSMGKTNLPTTNLPTTALPVTNLPTTLPVTNLPTTALPGVALPMPSGLNLPTPTRTVEVPRQQTVPLTTLPGVLTLPQTSQNIVIPPETLETAQEQRVGSQSVSRSQSRSPTQSVSRSPSQSRSPSITSSQSRSSSRSPTPGTSRSTTPVTTRRSGSRSPGFVSPSMNELPEPMTPSFSPTLSGSQSRQ
jgi:hypothetical protein